MNFYLHTTFRKKIDWVWLAIASELQKSFMRKNVFTLPVSFTGSYTPRMSQILLGKIIRVILQKKEGVYKVVNFKDFSRPYKDIKYFLRT